MTSLIVRAYALVLLVGLPLLAAREDALARGLDELDRRALYLSAAISSAFIAGLTLGVAAWQGVGARALGWVVGPAGRAAAWAAGTTAAGLAAVTLVALVASRRGKGESPLLLALMPRTPAERRGFVLLSLAAAVCEEYVFRGFGLRVLAAWTGNPWTAAAAVAVAFGLAHGYQRAAGVARAALLGGVLAVPVVLTGSLFPAIVAHFWINVILGLGGWRWLPGAAEPGE